MRCVDPSVVAPPLKNQAVHNKANGCFAIQDRASGKYLSDGSGNLVFDSDTAGDASGFTLKATGLGTLAFFDENDRFMSLSTGREALTDGGCADAQTATDSTAGAGHLLAIVAPAAPIAEGITTGSEWELDLPDFAVAANRDHPVTDGVTMIPDRAWYTALGPDIAQYARPAYLQFIRSTT